MAYLLAAGKTIPLTKEIVLGSGGGTHDGATLPIADSAASPQHARLWLQGSAWWVEDLHSASGTLVNERKLLGGPVKLAEGDRISIGAVVLEYHVGQSSTGEQVKAPERLPVGTKAGPYTISGLLGDGVATTIYKATFATGEVALHVVDQTLVAGDGGFAKRFLNDIELAANVRHSGALRIHRAGELGRTAWYSTDILGGETLAQRLGAPLDPELALDLVLSLCETLLPYAQVGLVHGDLKPRSLSLVGEREVRLMDIGLIGLKDAERQRAQARSATRQAYYLCPQQASRGDCNARSDLYSIGCILVHMLTGRPPFIGADFAAIMAAHVNEPVPQLAAQYHLPPSFDTVLGDLLHKEQFFRYDTIEVALARLREVRAALMPPPPPRSQFAKLVPQVLSWWRGPWWRTKR